MANENAISVLNKTKQNVIQKLDDYISQGQIIMPPNYSYGNALNLLQLQIQDDQKIMACTQNSIAKAMLDLAILGLNASKNQAYIIPYGNQAKLHVSYMGRCALAKRVDPTIEDIVGRVVKDGEIFEFEDLPNGYSRIVKHQRTLQSMDSKDIIGAYATIIYNDGKEPKSLIMTFDRIKKSWSKSQMHPVNPDGTIKKGTTHSEFSEEMGIRTVINAICKPIINTADDSSLFFNTVQSIEIDETAAQAREEVSENNGVGPVIDFIDAEFEPIAEVENVENHVEDVESDPREAPDAEFTLF